MIDRTRLPRLLAKDCEGATVVEFAIICIPLMIMMFGLFALGYRQYVSVQLQDALDQAARQVTVGTGTTATQLANLVKGKIDPVAGNATVIVVPTSYDKYQRVAKAEPITTDVAPIGSYNAGDCFSDINGNDRWDADAGKAGTGGSDDVVLYTATVSYPEIVPMKSLLGWASTETLTATTMLKNQPYASQPEPATVCT